METGEKGRASPIGLLRATESRPLRAEAFPPEWAIPHLSDANMSEYGPFSPVSPVSPQTLLGSAANPRKGTAAPCRILLSLT